MSGKQIALYEKMVERNTMSFDEEYLTFSNGVRLLRSGLIGYHRNSNENFTRLFTISDKGLICDESPDEVDVLLGKTVSAKRSCVGCLNNCEDGDCREE